MSDYKQTRDAAGKVTTQYDKMLRSLNDDDLKTALREWWEYDHGRLIENSLARIEELEAALPEQIEWVKRLADDLIAAEAKLAKAVEASIDIAASLAAAISLLERGGKKAAASDRMFAQMLLDYNASLDRFRTTLAELKGQDDE